MPPPKINSPVGNKIVFGSVPEKKGHRAILYGTGGIGKTFLACQAPGVSAMVDADESLPVLRGQLIEHGVDVPQVVPCSDFKSLRDALNSPGWEGINNIVLDTGTRIEEWSVAYTCETVPSEKGKKVSSIEGYGYGKGYQHNFDSFLLLLGDLDQHIRQGRNVIIVCHECTSNVPNPKGEDWMRYEPRLQNPGSGKASIRSRIKEWADHVMFLGYDVEVNKETGVAMGHGSRTLYTSELPFCMAKSRTTNESFNIERGGENPWPSILK